jgi:hypothetical protein
MTKKQEAIEALDEIFDEVHGKIAQRLKDKVLDAFDEIESSMSSGKHPTCDHCSSSSEIPQDDKLYCSRLNSGDYAVSPCKVHPDFFCKYFSFK